MYFCPMQSLPDILDFSKWKHKHPDMMLISGPCSAESELQLRSTAKALMATAKLDMLRAGVWKPRTRPGTFEGHGEKALQWLSKIKQDYNIPLAVEVAQPEHVELALRYGVDMLWIGARTTVNPFYVQAIAEAVKGTDIAILVKNPTHPETALWVGALERFYAAGIRRLMAVHRGFHSYQLSKYRNLPLWEIPIELKRLLPQLPILVDPSHIAGKRSLLAELSQQAMDLGMNGLMIESHIAPDKALTDAKQQLLPQDVNTLVENLKIRSGKYIKEAEPLKEWRLQIDQLDSNMIQLLAKRLEIVDKIGDYKLANNIPFYQVERWRHIIAERIAEGKQYGIDEAFLLKLLQLIHKASIRRQAEI